MDNQNEVVPEVKETAETKVPEPTAITQNEERLKALEAELATTKQNLKSVQGVLKKKDEEIKTASTFKSDIEGLKETQKILAAMLQERGTVSEENLDNIPKEKKQDYLKQFEDVQKRVEAKRQQEEVQAKIIEQVKGFQERTEVLGLKETDEAYIEVRELVESGLLKTADLRLKKLESQKEKKVETLKETEEQIFERIARQKGLLTTEQIVPAGGSGNRNQILQDYIAGKITDEKANEKLRAIGESLIA